MHFELYLFAMHATQIRQMYGIADSALASRIGAVTLSKKVHAAAMEGTPLT